MGGSLVLAFGIFYFRPDTRQVAPLFCLVGATLTRMLSQHLQLGIRGSQKADGSKRRQRKVYSFSGESSPKGINRSEETCNPSRVTLHLYVYRLNSMALASEPKLIEFRSEIIYRYKGVRYI